MILKAGGPADFQMKDLTINAQNNANSCYDIIAADGFNVSRVNCQGVITGSDHMLQMGSQADFAMDGQFVDNWASPPYQINYTNATLTPTYSGSGLTGLSCGTNCGSGYVPAYAVGIVNDPHHYCASLPTFTPTITAGGISGLTINSAGSCSKPPDFQVINQQKITYGMKLYISDSSIEDIQPNNGINGAIIYGGNNLIKHPHPTAIQNGLVINNSGNASIVGAELDTLFSVGISFQTTQCVSVTGTLPYEGSHNLPGLALYQFGSSGDNVQFGQLGALCQWGCPTDFQEFIGPSGVLTPYGTNWPAGVSVVGNDPVSGKGNVLPGPLAVGYTISTAAGPRFAVNTTGSGLGASITCLYATAERGSCTLTTGANPASNVLFTGTFPALTRPPICSLTAANAAAAALLGSQQVFVGGMSFTVSAGSTPLAPATQYQWNYHCDL